MKDYSNYHNADLNPKLKNDGAFIFNYALEHGYETHDVTINGVPTRAVIATKQESYGNSGEIFNIYTLPGLLHRGDIVICDRDCTWLVTSLPEDNGIYNKATMQICNTTIVVKQEPKKVVVGEDQFGRPIYQETEIEPLVFPCIAEHLQLFEDWDELVNVPSDRIRITMPFCDFKEDVFEVYGITYIRQNINYTKSIDGVGLLIIAGERQVL